MDIWEKLYLQAKAEYRPQKVSPFIDARHVVCALESQDGTIYTGFCIESACGVMHLCAERMAALKMYAESGQTVVRRMITFRDRPPYGGGSGMPCGACREFLMELSPENKATQIMTDYSKRRTITLGALMPEWWGEERLREREKHSDKVTEAGANI